MRSRAALQAEILSLRHQLLVQQRSLDHVLNEYGLRRILRSYFDYYERSRTHLSLAKDAPIPRPVQLPSPGRVIELLPGWWAPPSL